MLFFLETTFNGISSAEAFNLFSFLRITFQTFEMMLKATKVWIFFASLLKFYESLLHFGMEFDGILWGLSAREPAPFPLFCFFLRHMGGNNDHG